MSSELSVWIERIGNDIDALEGVTRYLERHHLRRDALLVRQRLHQVLQSGPEGHDLRMLDSLRAMSRQLEALGDSSGALDLCRQALDRSERQVSKNPHDAQRQRDLYVDLLAVGEKLQTQGNPSAALSLYQRAVAVTERRFAKDPLSTECREDLSHCYSSIAYVYAQREQYPEAIRYAQQGLSILQSGGPASPAPAPAPESLGGAYRTLGDMTVAQGNAAGARAPHRQDLALAQQRLLENESDTASQLHLAMACNRLGL